MKKYLFLFNLLLFTIGYTQSIEDNLKFETKYYDAVDTWVAFPKKTNGLKYFYGFIYIDQIAGFTFNIESEFEIKNNQIISGTTDKNGYTKIRLGQRTLPVHILTNQEIKKLNLPSKPKWLDKYKNNENTVSYMKDIGNHYNHSGASERALPYLEKAYIINSKYKGLEFELAYAYNATKKYEKAVKILNDALKESGIEDFLLKELAFSYSQMNKISLADEASLKGIKKSKNESLKAELAYNMVYLSYSIKDMDRFNKWNSIIKKLNPNDFYLKNIELMNKDLKKK